MKKGLVEGYKFYKNTVKNPVDRKTYSSLSGKYCKFLIEKVLEGHEVKLPMKLGTLRILGRKQKVRFDENGKVKGLAPDWVKTKQLWESNPEAKKQKKLMYHLNPDTDNVRYKYFWSKLNVLVENKTLYALRMSRANKRAAYTAIKQGRQYKTDR